jgi:hypothetical protein
MAIAFDNLSPVTPSPNFWGFRQKLKERGLKAHRIRKYNFDIFGSFGSNAGWICLSTATSR